MNDQIKLPPVSCKNWKAGFPWKNLYIKLLSSKDMRYIKREMFMIKSHTIKHISDKDIFFPLMGYASMCSLVLVVTTLLPLIDTPGVQECNISQINKDYKLTQHSFGLVASNFAKQEIPNVRYILVPQNKIKPWQILKDKIEYTQDVTRIIKGKPENIEEKLLTKSTHMLFGIEYILVSTSYSDHVNENLSDGKLNQTDNVKGNAILVIQEKPSNIAAAPNSSLSYLLSQLEETNEVMNHTQLKHCVHSHGYKMRQTLQIFYLLKVKSIQKKLIAADILLRAIRHVINYTIEIYYSKHPGMIKSLTSEDANVFQEVIAKYKEEVIGVINKFRQKDLPQDIELCFLLRTLRTHSKLSLHPIDMKSIYSEIIELLYDNPIFFIHAAQHFLLCKIPVQLLNDLRCDKNKFPLMKISTVSLEAKVIEALTTKEFALSKMCSSQNTIVSDFTLDLNADSSAIEKYGLVLNDIITYWTPLQSYKNASAFLFQLSSQLILIAKYYPLLKCNIAELLIINSQSVKYTSIEGAIIANTIYSLAYELSSQIDTPNKSKQTMIDYIMSIMYCLQHYGDPRGIGSFNIPWILIPLWRYDSLAKKNNLTLECGCAEEIIESTRLELNIKDPSSIPVPPWTDFKNTDSRLKEIEILKWIIRNFPQVEANEYSDQYKIQATANDIANMPIYANSFKKTSTHINNISAYLDNHPSSIQNCKRLSTSYVWGGNSCDQSAIKMLSKDYNILNPRMIVALKNYLIKSISCGHRHSIVLTYEGKLLGWGDNQYGQLGIGLECPSSPTPFPISLNAVISKVSCGSEHSVALSDASEVYTWGQCEGGILGYKTEKLAYSPQKINLQKIKKICAGALHTLALNDRGELYSWGKGDGGQLGLELEKITKENGASQPTIISVLKGKTVKRIACGEAHSIALLDTGEVYGWGFCNYGQLGFGISCDSFDPGTGNEQSIYYIPHLLDVKNIKKIYSGYTFSLFITATNQILGCGMNDLGQLGIEILERAVPLKYKGKPLTSKDVLIPTACDLLENLAMKKLSCGESHCIAVANDTLLIGWGLNTNGQLGNCEMSKFSVPRPVKLNGEKAIVKIGCGAYHSIAVLKIGSYDSISNYNYRCSVLPGSIEI